MHPGVHAAKSPEKAAYIMASSGRVVTYGELNADSNRIAHLLRDLGLKAGGHIAIFMENNADYFKLCWAAHRAGLYYTCISSHLQLEEIAYILQDCGAQVFFTSSAKADLAARLNDHMAGVRHRFLVDGALEGYQSLPERLADYSAGPITDEEEGSDMLYSSGTTGRPKGIKPALKGEPLGTIGDATRGIIKLYRLDWNAVYLSPAPLYHAAPLRFNMMLLRLGATCIVMERFEPEQALALIEKYRASHSQWVPTMFVRFLKLPPAVRQKYDLSSMTMAIHAAAPCPPAVKRQMIDWWGPVIQEYYAGTEGNGFTTINSEDWLAHVGSVGRALVGVLHIMGPDGEELGPGREGSIYFESDTVFAYHNDPEKTAESRNDRGWSTLGDVGYLDEDGYLYLTDRKAFMIISGGVNIYPQEIEDLLVSHPAVMDAAVIGVPSDDFGEAVKAVVQLIETSQAGEEMAEQLLAFCRQHISHIKCPRSLDFEAELPRLDNGKLYKRLLRDRYWAGREAKIG